MWNGVTGYANFCTIWAEIPKYMGSMSNIKLKNLHQFSAKKSGQISERKIKTAIENAL